MLNLNSWQKSTIGYRYHLKGTRTGKLKANSTFILIAREATNPNKNS